MLGFWEGKKRVMDDGMLDVRRRLLRVDTNVHNGNWDASCCLINFRIVLDE